jgi:hypothetical protein
MIAFLALALLTMANAAPNACRDNAVCCTTINFSSAQWPQPPAATLLLSSQGTLPWSEQGLAFRVDQTFGSPPSPYPLGLLNISQPGIGSLVAGSQYLVAASTAQDNYVLAAFNGYPTAMLYKSQTIHLALQKQPACVAHLRTLRSVLPSTVRESLRITLARYSVPGNTSSPLVSMQTLSTTYTSADMRPDNDYELTLTQIDDLKIDWYGQGYGALASVEVCYYAPNSLDQCGVCGGTGQSCANSPGSPCDTGLGTTVLSGDCSQGTVNDLLQCVPNRSTDVEICNGLDDNCNGLVDDGIWPTISCGVGACYREYAGCIGGRVITQSDCRPNSPTTEICDGIDNNCNGLIDEGNVCNSPSSTRAPAPSSTATNTPSSTSAPSASQTATPTPSSSMAPSQSASPPPTHPPTPSASPLPAVGQAYLLPQLVCVAPLAGPLMQATFTYVYVGSAASPTQLTLPVAPNQNWVSVWSSAGAVATVGQTQQPTQFVANWRASQFTILFQLDQEVQWTLRANASIAPDLGQARQVAVANRYSAQCGAAALNTMEPVEPVVNGCVVQRNGATCTLVAGYYNPNPQSVQLPVGAATNQFVQSANDQPLPQSQQQWDRDQPRVFFPGTVQRALQFDFDCSQNLWSLEWQLTTLNTTRRMRVDQSSVC